MKVLVCGSRGLTSERDGTRIHFLLTALLEGFPWPVEILEGGARGADFWARDWAVFNGAPYRTFPADWDRYGKGAGFIRNSQMLDEQPALVVAFWDGTSPGTAHTVREAKARGIPVKVITIVNGEVVSRSDGPDGTGLPSQGEPPEPLT